MHKVYKHHDMEISLYKYIVELRDELGMKSVDDTISHYLPPKIRKPIQPITDIPKYSMPLELPAEIKERMERRKNGVNHDQPDRFFDPSLAVEEEEEEVIEIEKEIEKPKPLTMPKLPTQHINVIHGIIRGGK